MKSQPYRHTHNRNFQPNTYTIMVDAVTEMAIGLNYKLNLTIYAMIARANASSFQKRGELS